MKFLKLFTLFCIVCFTVKAQPIPSHCTGPAQLYKTYYRDVKEIAVAYINGQKVADTMQIDPPQAYLDTIFAALSAVYNIRNKQSDTLFNTFCVHSESAYKQMLIDVFVDGSAWTNSWENRQITTGITDLDDLLANYHFSVYKFSNGGGFRWATLITDSIINMPALADTLKKFSGIYDAVPGQWPSLMVPDRTYLVFGRDTVSYLGFQLHWGSFNQYSHSWSYKIDNNCNVTFLGSVLRTYDRPDLYASPVNCNLFPLGVEEIKNKVVQVYPNPAADYITVESASGLRTISISDMYGRELNTVSTLGIKQTINTSNFSAGVYMIRIEGIDHRVTVKIIQIIK